MPNDHERPLVSIICRSTGRRELEQALASVAAQSHAPIELVLVEAGGKSLAVEPGACAPARLVVVNRDKPLPRANAANAGLAAAGGDYLIFLDEDDWIAPGHVAGLLDGLRGNPQFQAAYSSTQKTDFAGAPIDYVFDQDFDPVLLLRDNYIPIHAMLFARGLIDRGCEFDEQFSIYEDWDFWLQLQQHTDFLHINQLSAFYREGGESATAAGDVTIRYDNDSPLGQARTRLFDKWLPRFSGARFNSLIGQLDQSALIRELVEKLDNEHAVNLAHQDEIRQLVDERVNLQDQIGQKSHEIASLKVELENTRHALEADIADLERVLYEIHHSTSWKLTAPYRFIGRKVKAMLKQAPDNDSKPK